MEFKSVLEDNTEENILKVSKIIITLYKKIKCNPSNIEHRKVELDSDVFTELLSINDGVNCLFNTGFVENNDSLYLPLESSLDKMTSLYSLLLAKRKEILSNIYKEVRLPDLIRENEFLIKIEKKFNDAQRYSDEDLLNKARELMPLEDLKLKALTNMREIQCQIKSGESNDMEPDIDDILLVFLLKWFKNSFFKWVNSPKCTVCNGKTEYKTSESILGLRTEIFWCDKCKTNTDFIRYNDLSVLLETRCGRCGEWANVFTLMCCALGWDARFVVDETDHVWTEVWSTRQNRWLHCDPCETAIDTPLMYEAGWKKELSYILAYSPFEVQDVTWRYSVDHAATRMRRTQCTENNLVLALVILREKRQALMLDERRDYLNKRILKEIVELMQQRKISDNDIIGRQSGSLLWRLSRGETSVNTNKTTKHVWVPHNGELQIHIQYNPTSDMYEQLDTNKQVISKVQGWQNGCHEISNIFRKVESDWEMVYLARTELSDEGMISWIFSSENTDLNISHVNVTLCRNVYENAEIDAILKTNNGQTFKIAKDLNSYYVPILPGANKIELAITLKGGVGSNAWQHAQIFRQSLNNNEYLFIVNIQLCKPNI